MEAAMQLLKVQPCEPAARCAGKYVDIKDTISGFQGVLQGKYDDLPEMAFYMVRTAVSQLLGLHEGLKAGLQPAHDSFLHGMHSNDLARGAESLGSTLPEMAFYLNGILAPRPA